MSDDTTTAPRVPLLVVLSGPSGAGKDAVLDEMGRLGYRFHRVITCTTRAARDNEQDGVDYHFIDDDEFDRLIHTGGFLEHAVVYGHRSGVPRQQVVGKLAEGSDVVVRADVQGAATIKKLAPGAVLIFIAPSSIAEIEERIRARGSDDEEHIQRRLRTAVSEMARQDEYDYIVVNEPGHLTDTATEVLEILDRERRRPRTTPIFA